MDKEALKKEALQFLKDQQLGVLSTVDKDSVPESATVNYLADDSWVLFIITNKDSRKVNNLKQNPHVAFVAGTTPVPHTVQIQGTAEIIETENPAYEELHKKLVDSKRLENDPMYDIFGHNYVMVKITITWLRWLSFDQTNGNPVYTELIP